MEKKEKKLRNKSKGQTPGKVKGENCKADTFKKYMAKSSRSYKHPDYHKGLICGT